MWKAPKHQMNASHPSAQLSPHVVSFLLARVPSPSTESTLHILYCFYIFSHSPDSPNRPEKAWIWGIMCLRPRPNKLGTRAWLPGPSHPAAPVLIHTAPSHRMKLMYRASGAHQPGSKGRCEGMLQTEPTKKSHL